MPPYGAGLYLTRLLGRCTLCRLRPIENGYLCHSCHEATFLAHEPVVFEVGANELWLQSAGYYVGVMRQAISRFKDDERLETLPVLVQALRCLGEYTEDLPADTLILPVPTTKGRLAKRGFYPVGILARHLSVLTGFGIYTGVVRPSEGLHQRGLDRYERLQNLQGAFLVDELPSSRHILIFDDVVTTGATLCEIAECLWQTDPDLQILAVCLAHGSPK